MNTFRRTTFIAIGIITLLCLYAAAKPDTFRVERSIDINTQADAIFPLMNDMQSFTRWSPYEGRDPDMKKTFSAITTGKGASYAWEGNKQVGSGRMEITQSISPQQIVIQLDFNSPIEAHNVVYLTLAPVTGGTRVTWAMQGPLPFFSRLFSIFMDFDAMVGNDFTSGLEKLKSIAEQPATRPLL